MLAINSPLSTRSVTTLASAATAHAPETIIDHGCGALHAFGAVAQALAALRERRAEGGRLLFGCEFWTVLPTDEGLAHMWPEAAVTDWLRGHRRPMDLATFLLS